MLRGSQQSEIVGMRGASHPFAKLVDTSESNGRHIIERFAKLAGPIHTVVDLGAGGGWDLQIVKRIYPDCKTIGVEALKEYAAAQQSRVDETILLNIERDELPFAAGSIDLVMANQILEHTKEVFWIFDQVFRALRIGGHFLIGVPNVASFHNRLLLLLGRQPTQFQLCSAHVRPFSKKDTVKFLSACYPGCSVEAFAGAQFYPFPKSISRLLANTFPDAAYSIFFLIRKDEKYDGQFAEYPAKAHLETNYWCGNDTNDRYAWRRAD